MVNSSFTTLKSDLENASAFLGSFTLGRPGFTQRDGVAAVQRVKDLCEQMKNVSGPDAKEATTLVSSAEEGIEAAQARLVLLKGKH